MRNGYSYIGKCPKCGKYCAVVADEPGNEKVTSRIVADFIKSGLIVEHVSHEFVCRCFSTCKCDNRGIENIQMSMAI